MAVVNLFPEPSYRDQLLETMTLCHVDYIVQNARKKYLQDKCKDGVEMPGFDPKPLYKRFFTLLKEKVTAPVASIEVHMKGMVIFQKKMDKIKDWIQSAMISVIQGNPLEEEEPQIENDNQQEVVNRFADENFILEIKSVFANYTDRNLDPEARALRKGLTVKVLNCFKGEEKAFLEWFTSSIMGEVALAHEALMQEV
jgi:hypothetical protein